MLQHCAREVTGRPRREGYGSRKLPTIGIGAGSKCDGQVLVYADMLGMNKGFKPKFLRQYADLHSVITDAVGRYVADVKSSDFPNENESY